MDINSKRLQVLRSGIAIFWLGFFMSISFMEAPLKFSVLSLTEGLSVGRVVFKALNNCEWIFLALLGITLLLRNAPRLVTVPILLMCVVLLIETVWLLPVLDIRATRIIHGEVPPEGPVHGIYVALEIVKVPVLLMIAWQGVKGYFSKYPGTG